VNLADVQAVAVAPLRYIPGNPCLREVLAMKGTVKRSGLWCEFGVYRGETLRLLAVEKGEARLVGFDSFNGLPEDWTRPDTKVFRAGTFACPVPDVPGAEIVVGHFEDTLSTAAFMHTAQPLTFLHVDCDIYSAAKTVLEWAAPRLVNGAVVVFDELVGYPGFEAHEWRALGEAYDRGLRWEWLHAAGEGVAIRVVKP